MPSTLWLLTVFEVFKDYLVYKPKRNDYDLVFFKADNIQVAHVYLALLYIMSGQWQSLPCFVAFLSVAIAGWLEYSLREAGIGDRIKSVVQAAATYIEKTLNAHRLIPNYITGPQALKHENACTDHLEPFDRRTINPRDMRRQEW